MMAMTPRDRVILMLMPGLAILVMYVAYFFTARQKPMAKLQADVAAAREQVPGAQLVHDRQQALKYAQKKMDDANAKAKELQSALDAKIRLCQTGVGRSQRITKLTDLFNHHNLQVLDHMPADGARDAKSMKLSAAQERLVKQLVDSGKPIPQAWQFDLYGKFTDLAAALEELGEGELIAVPLGVTMDEVKDVSPHRRWALMIWI
jgi:hypothetical protein